MRSLAVRSHLFLSDIAHDLFQPEVSVYPVKRGAPHPLLCHKPSLLAGLRWHASHPWNLTRPQSVNATRTTKTLPI
jgi:hypothetical protein